MILKRIENVPKNYETISKTKSCRLKVCVVSTTKPSQMSGHVLNKRPLGTRSTESSGKQEQDSHADHGGHGHGHHDPATIRRNNIILYSTLFATLIFFFVYFMLALPLKAPEFPSSSAAGSGSTSGSVASPSASSSATSSSTSSGGASRLM